MQKPCLSYAKGVFGLSVCLSHSAIVSKQRKLSSQNLHCRLP